MGLNALVSAEKTREIPDLIDRSESLVGMLHETIDRLEGRLHHVVRHEPTGKSIGEDVAAKNTQLGERLDNHCSRIESADERLKDFLRRLEL